MRVGTPNKLQVEVGIYGAIGYGVYLSVNIILWSITDAVQAHSQFTYNVLL